MTWTEPDVTRDWFPEGTCECGADLDGAADLGVARSCQQKEVPEPEAVTVQHDLHETRCQCGKTHVAARPPGVPDSAVSIGPRLRALAVYLLVFQHLPVERCRQLLSDVAGAEVSAGFIHSCLAKAASMAAGTVMLIKTLLIAAKVVGFDETTLRSGAAGEKKYVHGAFTERYSLFHLGTRSLETMKDFGILPDFAGIAVTDRYGNYFHATWKNISGHQACVQHILRDLQDCAETYPGTIWPGQAQDALRKLIHARNQASGDGLDAIPAAIREPLRQQFRRAITVALADVPPHPRPEEHHQAASRPGHAGVLPRPRSRRPEIHHRHRRVAHEQHQRVRTAAEQDPAKDLRQADQRRHHPGPPRHPQLHRHRPQARPRRPHRPARTVHREPLDAPGSRPGLTPRTTLPRTHHIQHLKHHPGHTGECFRPLYSASVIPAARWPSCTSTASKAYGLALRRSHSISDQRRTPEATVFTDLRWKRSGLRDAKCEQHLGTYWT